MPYCNISKELWFPGMGADFIKLVKGISFNSSNTVTKVINSRPYVFSINKNHSI